jgi:hypothetical protein
MSGVCTFLPEGGMELARPALAIAAASVFTVFGGFIAHA